MRRVLLGMAICLSLAAHAQNDTALLRSAGHCLIAKNFLPHTKAAKFTFGYLLDATSNPGEKMLYVINYPNASKPDGFVFTIFLTTRNYHDVFNIQNNARFIFSRSGNEKISFVSPALGGAWTQEHIESAIKQIEKQPRLTIMASSLLEDYSSLSCKAYTDPQPKLLAK